MPEGPTIKILAAECQQFVGETVLKATALTNELKLSKFKGQRIKEIRSYGKQLIIIFDEFSIRVHLMLFGYYAINSKISHGKLRLGLHFQDGELNFYAADIRFIDEPLDNVYDWRTDVLNPAFDMKLAVEKLNNLKNDYICDALLDQDIFAGVGNMIKNDMLFKAKVHPLSRAVDVPEKEKMHLANEAVIVSLDFLEWKTSGLPKNKFVAHFKKICPRDKIPFKKSKVGRGHRVTYYCDACQVKY